MRDARAQADALACHCLTQPNISPEMAQRLKAIIGSTLMYALSSAILPAAFSARGAVASVFAGALACLAGLGLSSTSAHADAAACKSIEAAMIANTKTPFHSFATITFSYAAPLAVAGRNLKLPASQSSETIFTGKAVYVRLLPGKWQPLPTSLAQFQEQVHASVAGLKNCQHLPDQTVNGATLAVYDGATKEKNGPVQTKVWVSVKGIPVKSETDIEIGHTPGGDMIHQHLSTRYEYGDIRAPALD